MCYVVVVAAAAALFCFVCLRFICLLACWFVLFCSVALF